MSSNINRYYKKESMMQIIQYLNLLPYPYRMQAISNTSNDTLFHTAESLREALLIAFIWGNTAEGHSYWKEVFEMARAIDCAA